MLLINKLCRGFLLEKFLERLYVLRYKTKPQLFPILFKRAVDIHLMKAQSYLC